jgi:hypothetical protein
MTFISSYFLLYCNIYAQAIGLGLSCVTEEYEGVMKEPVMPLLSRMVTDRSAGTRKELCSMCETVVCRRLVAFGRSSIESSLSLPHTSESGSKAAGAVESKPDMNSIPVPGAASVCADVQLIALLVLLRGDESEEVAQSALNVSNSIYSCVLSHLKGSVFSPICVSFSTPYV